MKRSSTILSAEVAEWIEAFDDVVAHDWEQGAAVLSALRTRAREAGVPATGDDHYAVLQHDSEV